MTIGAVVVTYNSAGCIETCLDGLLSSPLVTEIVIVDNHSSDDTVALARPRDPRIVLAPLARNRGFAAAANLGAKQVTSPVLAFVNPDATISSEAIRTLLSALESKASIWAVGPALLNQDGQPEYSARGFPSAWSTLLNRRFLSMFPRSRSRELRRFLNLDADRTTDFECDWLSGALFLIRRNDFLACNGFDEKFFMYYEDADLFRRRDQARSALFVGRAIATHTIGQSSRRLPIRAGVWRVRSSWRYYRKHVRRGLHTDVLYMIGTASGVLLEFASFFRKSA